VLLQYVGIVGCQMAQRVLCVNYHSVLQRLARSLLMTRDRSNSSELFITHEALALMLGVRRESVSVAARDLQAQGLISYRRGYVILLDVGALKTKTCACYHVDQASYAQLEPFGAPLPASPSLFSTSTDLGR
jgi:DNA-binding transcriptional MocR family regulator